MQITEAALLDYMNEAGIRVHEAELPPGYWGYYDKEQQLIVLQRGMTGSQRLATMLHELAHHSRGDAGHQASAVEDAINEDVARYLVDPAQYAFWESELGWSPGGIAAALELPRWVIEAYRRVLARSACTSSGS